LPEMSEGNSIFSPPGISRSPKITRGNSGSYADQSANVLDLQPSEGPKPQLPEISEEDLFFSPPGISRTPKIARGNIGNYADQSTIVLDLQPSEGPGVRSDFKYDDFKRSGPLVSFPLDDDERPTYELEGELKTRPLD
jgi:hypothetical protein